MFRLRVMGRTGGRFFAGAILVCSSAAALAHHAIVAKFDDSSTLRLEGVVTKVDWRNPHAHVFLNVESNQGTANWAIELESPIDLVANGWQSDSVQPGDALVIDGYRARDGSRQMWGETVVLAKTGRTVFNLDFAAPTLPLGERPTPRWPNGQPALGAVPGSAGGYWGFPSATALVENGVDVEISVDGLLSDLDDARRVAPMQSWARGLFEHRQSRQLRDDPLFLNCKPPGGPRQYESRHGVQFIEDRERERIFVLIGSGNRNYRIIFLDGREQAGQVGGDDDNPLYYGRSAGRWEGDTLVVDTRGFNEDFWMTNSGLPHTNQLVLTEKFSRPNLDTLQYEVTIDDPGAYTRPWTASWSLRWVGGEELPANFCQNNRP